MVKPVGSHSNYGFAIDGYLVRGRNNFAFGKFVFEHETFRSGNFDTHFVKKYNT
jgi:propionyl-CoA carboxylase alpha chain